MEITSTDEVTLLGVSIDNKVTFKNHIDELYRKISYKLHALRRIRTSLSKGKARLLANAFINCQFLYAPLIWMLVSKISINKTGKTLFRTLQIVIMPLANSTRSYLLPGMISLCIKNTFVFWR